MKELLILHIVSRMTFDYEICNLFFRQVAEHQIVVCIPGVCVVHNIHGTRNCSGI